jgi:hypothetical protein
MNRKLLPQRRHAETFNLNFNNLRHTVTIGRYPDGSIGEVFIDFEKSGMPMGAIARDGAIMLSLALQYGATLENMRSAVTRDDEGAPTSIMGAVVDKLSEFDQ